MMMWASLTRSVLLYGVFVAAVVVAATNNDEKLSSNNHLDLHHLNSKMSDYFGRVHATNKTMWMRECVEYIKRSGFGMMGNQVKYSTYYYKDKPSGLCNLLLWSDFYGWTPAIQGKQHILYCINLMISLLYIYINIYIYIYIIYIYTLTI